jgi:hypothetical protein
VRYVMKPRREAIRSEHGFALYRLSPVSSGLSTYPPLACSARG